MALPLVALRSRRETDRLGLGIKDLLLEAIQASGRENLEGILHDELAVPAAVQVVVLRMVAGMKQACMTEHYTRIQSNQLEVWERREESVYHKLLHEPQTELWNQRIGDSQDICVFSFSPSM